VTGIDASKDMINAPPGWADAGGVHVDLRVASVQLLPFRQAEPKLSAERSPSR
jgi:hypothetical protein